jgi:hypothetical protein
MRSVVLWDITQRILVIPYWCFGKIILDCLTLEDGADRLPRIFGKQLPLYAASHPRTAQISLDERWRNITCLILRNHNVHYAISLPLLLGLVLHAVMLLCHISQLQTYTAVEAPIGHYLFCTLDNSLVTNRPITDMRRITTFQSATDRI